MLAVDGLYKKSNVCFDICGAYDPAYMVETSDFI
jgi:hypothetical protein